MIDAREVRRQLRVQAERYGSQVALSRALGCSTTFVNDCLRGHREPSGAILDFLGLERVTLYRQRTKPQAKRVPKRGRIRRK